MKNLVDYLRLEGEMCVTKVLVKDFNRSKDNRDKLKENLQELKN